MDAKVLEWSEAYEVSMLVAEIGLVLVLWGYAALVAPPLLGDLWA